MSAKILSLAELFHSSLITRQAAREVFDIVSKLPETDVQLDFANVKFASRSFFDELNSKSSQMALLSKKITFINLNPNIEQLFDLVSSAAKSRSSISYSSAANSETIVI